MLRAMKNKPKTGQPKIAIEEAAEQVADRCNLPPAEVRRVYERLNEVGWRTPDFPRLSALEEAFKLDEPKKILDIFLMEKDLLKLCERVLIYDYLKEDFAPLHTIWELTELIHDFLEFFTRKENEEHLLMTGYPRRIFVKSLWLDYLVNRLYPIKIPLNPPRLPGDRPAQNTLFEFMSPDLDWEGRPYDEWGNIEQIYTWGDSSPEPEAPDPPLREEDFYLRTLGYLRDNSNFLTKHGGRIRECTYENAKLLPKLRMEDASYLEKNRMRIYRLKVNVLERIEKALIAGNTNRIIESCADHVHKSGIFQDDVMFFFAIDQFQLKYLNRWSAMYSNRRRAFFQSSGGLTELFNLLGHCKKEIELEVMHSACQKIVHDLSDVWQFPSYYGTLGHLQHEQLNKALDLLKEAARKESRFLDEYESQLNRQLIMKLKYSSDNSEVSKRNLRGTFTPSNYNILAYAENYFRNCDAILPAGILNTGESHSTPSREAEGGASSKSVVARFPSPKDLQWREVSIAFISNDDIEIKARGHRERYNYRELGFKDSRKKGDSSPLWKRFRELLAKQNGEFCPGSRLKFQNKVQLRATMKEIRKRLRAIMNIEDDPIPFNYETRCYMTKFGLWFKFHGEDHEENLQL